MTKSRRCVFICTVFSFAVLHYSHWNIDASPATTSASATHIVSYVKQRRVKSKYDAFPNFDFESIKGNSSNTEGLTQKDPVQQIYGRFIEQLDTDLNVKATTAKSEAALERSDDLDSSKLNTLDNPNEIFGSDQHHESTAMEVLNDMWNRTKQSIPVLEPVRHLLNTVREGGGLNYTTRDKNNHHQLVSPNNTSMASTTESSAIETEQDREMELESNDFKFLEVLGRFGGMLWEFFKNIQRIFAASGGSASAASRFGGS